MRHNRANATFGLTVDHRKALLANLIQSLVRKKKIRTTTVKAKELSRYADKLITIARKQTLAARRQLISETRSQDAAKLLIEVIAPAFKNRNGGYTRVLKTDNRPGDNAPMAFLEFTEDYEIPGKPEEKKKAKKEKPAKETAKKTVKKEEKTEEKKAEKEPETEDEKKSSGFLGNLRGFLKGE